MITIFKKTFFEKQIVLFQHIPKTAGSTVYHMLKNSPSQLQVYRFDWFDQCSNFIKKNGGLKGVDILCCHISEKELSYIKSEVGIKKFVFWRDPIKRVISNYLFWRAKNEGDQIEDAFGKKIKFLDHSLNWEEDLVRIMKESNKIWKYKELSNIASWQLGHSIYERESLSEKEVLKNAKNSISKSFFVGRQEMLDHDLKTLFSMQKWGVCDSIKVRINETNSEFFSPSSNLISEIEKYNYLDLELDCWIRGRL